MLSSNSQCTDQAPGYIKVKVCKNHKIIVFRLLTWFSDLSLRFSSLTLSTLLLRSSRVFCSSSTWLISLAFSSMSSTFSSWNNEMMKYKRSNKKVIKCPFLWTFKYKGVWHSLVGHMTQAVKFITYLLYTFWFSLPFRSMIWLMFDLFIFLTHLDWRAHLAPDPAALSWLCLLQQNSTYKWKLLSNNQLIP